MRFLFCLFLISSVVLAGDPEKFEIPQDVQDSVDAGLEFLAKRQQADGSILAGGFGSFNREMCYTALAGMAFMSEGSKPKSGKYGTQISKCVDYILRHQTKDGLLAAENHDKLYQHGFVLLFMCEVYGETTRDAEVKRCISKAVKLLVDSQSKKGGWRYDIPSNDEDLSVTGAQMMALRAAKTAGFHVPGDVIEKAKKYIISLQNADGSFNYTEGSFWDTGHTRTACALSALYSAGLYDGNIVEKAKKHMWKYDPNKKLGQEGPTHFFYAHYYAIFAAKQEGKEKFAEWYKGASRLILKKFDKKEKYWNGDTADVYDTAMACIILQVPNGCLPLFQD